MIDVYKRQVQAPAGFVTTEEIKEFDFAYAGEEVAEVSFEFTYEDEPTTFEITKMCIRDRQTTLLQMEQRKQKMQMEIIR